MSHKGSHYINVRNIETNEFDKQIYVNNAHHQLVWTENKLEDENYIVYGWCKLSDYHDYEEGVQLDVQIEPEIIYFPKVKALAAQFHPEWMSKSNPKDLQTLTYIEELVNKLF